MLVENSFHGYYKDTEKWSDECSDRFTDKYTDTVTDKYIDIFTDKYTEKTYTYYFLTLRQVRDQAGVVSHGQKAKLRTVGTVEMH